MAKLGHPHFYESKCNFDKMWFNFRKDKCFLTVCFFSHQFSQQITGMRFCEASAKDNFNVDEIFLKLVDDILKKVVLLVQANEELNV